MDFQEKNHHWISMLEASRLCSYSQEYLSLLARRGKIFSKKIGRNWFTTREAVDDYLKTQSVFISLPKNVFGKLTASLTPEEPEEVAGHEGHSRVFEEFEKLNPQISFGYGKEVNSQNPVVTQPSIAPFGETDDVKPIISQDPVLKKLDKLSDSLGNFAERVTRKLEQPKQEPLTAEQKEFFEIELPSLTHRFKIFDRYARSMMRNPIRVTVIMVTAIVAIFIIAGGFSFGQVDDVVQGIKKVFKDADTVQGHFPGTHANEVLVLDKAGNVSIFGHIETQGQLRSHAPDGVAPMVIDSTTLVENLNANYLDGLASKDFTLAFVTKNGNLTYEDVKLEGNVEVGKTLMVKGATKLLDSLQVYGNLGVFGDAVFGKNITVTNGDLILKKGTITINNTSLIKNLNAEYLDGIKKQSINLDFVTSNGASTANGITIGGLEVNGQSDFRAPGFFYKGVWGSDGAFGTLGVAGDATIGDSDRPEDSHFTVYSKKFRVDENGNVSISGTLGAGNTTVSDLTLTGSVKSDLIPSGSYDLGSSANRWVDVFAQNLNISGTFTASGSVNFAGTASSSFAINTDNATADTEDSYLSFERGATTPNATLKWNSSNNRFEFNEPLFISSSSLTTFSVSGGPASISNTLYVQNNGNVGIGTTSPIQKLQVNDTATAAFVVTSAGQVGIGTTEPATVFEVQGTASASYLLTGNTLQVGGFASAAYSRFGTSATTHGLSATNDLLINGKLEVDGSAYFDGTVNFSGIASSSLFYAQPGTAASPSFAFAIDQDTGMFRSAVNQLGFSTLGAERLTIKSDGNVGIGTTGPTRTLDVTSNVVHSTNGLTSQLTVRGTADSTQKLNVGYDTTSNYGFIEAVDESVAWKNLALQPTGGNVGIGITVPLSKLHVVDSLAANANGQAALIVDGLFLGTTIGSGPKLLFRYSTGGTEAASVRAYTFGTSLTGLAFDTGWGALTTKMVINNGGNVGIGTTTPSSLLTVQGRGEFQGTASASYFLTGNTIQVGGYSSESYSRFGTGTTGHSNYISTTNDLLISGDLEVDGSAAFDGHVVIGNATDGTDILTINSQIKSNLIPFDNSREIGSGTNRWQIGYFDKVDASEFIGASISFSGTNNETFTINADNATVDTENSQFVFERGSPTTNAQFQWDATNKRFNLNFPVFIQTADPSETANNFTKLILKGTTDQGSNDYFEIQDSNGSRRFLVEQSGQIIASGAAQFGGASVASVAYSRFGTAATGHGLSAVNDLLVSGKLEIDGNAYFDGTVNFPGIASSSLFYAQSGSASSPSFSFATDQDTGMFRPAVNQLGFSTLGVERIRVDSSGNVGINYGGAVDTKFEVAGTASISGNTYLATLSASNVGIGTTTAGNKLAVYGAIEFPENATGTFTGTTTGIYQRTLNEFNIVTGGEDRVSIDSSGNVGIGTTGQGNRLEVRAAGGADGIVLHESYAGISNLFTVLQNTGDGSGAIFKLYDGAGALAANTKINIDSGTGATYFNASGNVGIGSTSPSGKLDVVGDLTGNTNALFRVASTSDLFRVQENGNVGIGTASPLTRFEVQGTASASNLLTIGGLQVAGGTSVSYSRFGTSSTGHANYISASNDLLISGDLEVRGTASFAGGASISGNFNLTGDQTIGGNLTVSGTGSSSFAGSLSVAKGFLAGANNALVVNANATANTLNILGSNVGIGTTGPTSTLDVTGTGNITSSLTVPSIVGGTETTSDLNLKTTSGVGTTGADMHFLVGNNGATEAMTILNSGNVGIGQVTPGAKLEVRGATTDRTIIAGISPTGTGQAGKIIITSSYDSTGTYFDATRFTVYGSSGGFGNTTNYLGFDTATSFNAWSTKMALTLSGNVGIGTTTPTSLLTVQGRGEFQGTASASYLLTGNTIQVGGFASAAYSRFGTGTTTHSGNITTTNDLLISGDLEVDGNAYFDGTTNFNIASASYFYAQPGTAASPSFAFAIDQDTGMFRSAVNQLGFSTLGAERLTIKSDGNVGIGTTGPTTELQIAGTTPFLTIGDAGAEDAGVIFDGNAFDFHIGLDDSADDLVIGTGSTLGSSDLITIDSGGNVGIGQTPENDKKFTVTGDSRFTGSVFINGNGTHPAFWMDQYVGPTVVKLDTNGDSYLNGGNVGIGTTGPVALADIVGDASVLFRVASGSNERFRITEAGNVGIGESSPTALLEIKGGTASISNTLFVENNGNVGIGTTGPTSLLSVSSTATASFDITSQEQSDKRFTLRSNYQGAGTSERLMILNGAGTELVSIASSGNVGIGTTSPIYGRLQVTQSSDVDEAGIAVLNSGNSRSIRIWADSSNVSRIDSGDAGVGILALNGTGSGNIGIGTTSPDSLLELSSTTTNFIIRSTGSTSSASIDFQPAGGASSSNQGKFTIRAGGSASTGGERLEFLNGAATPLSLVTIASSGNVGIGTTAPSLARLHLEGSIYDQSSIKFNNTANSNTDTWRIGERGFSSSDTSLAVSLNDNGSGNDLFVVKNTGNVGIGTTTPTSALDIVGDTATLFNIASGSDSRFTVLEGGNVGIGDTGPDALLDVKGTVCLDLNADEACTDNTAAISDARLKTNVTTITNGLELIEQLHPVRFTWNGKYNTGTSDSLGFLAQEVEIIFPELVITDTAGYKNLDYSKLTAVLTGAVQELDGKYASLSFRVDELEARMASSSRETVVVESSGSGVETITSTTVDVLGTLANAVLTQVQTLWAKGDVIIEGVQKTYYSVSSVFDWEFDLATMVSGWTSREITFAPNVDDTTRSLFSGNGVQAAEQSKTDLIENGAYLATYGVDSTRGEIVLSGSSDLIGGEAKVFFDFSFSSIISPDVSLKVLLTPTTFIQGQIYVSDKTSHGFVVKGLNGALVGKFDWLVIARRKGFEGADAAPASLNVSESNSLNTGSTPASPSPTPEVTPEPESTPEATASPSPSPTPDATISPTPTLIPTPTPTPEATPTPAEEPSPTPTPSPTPESIPESTASPSPEQSPSPSPTI